MEQAKPADNVEMNSRLESHNTLRAARLGALILTVSVMFMGCGKKSTPAETAAQSQDNGAAPSTAPGPMPTPATPQTLPAAPANNMDETLAQLTRELHRTMIGRKLSGSFEEFVAIRNLTPPPPPPGKKYAISKKWRVVLVDQ